MAKINILENKYICSHAKQDSANKSVQNHAIMFISSVSLQEGSDTSGLYKMMSPNTATFLHSNIIKCSKQSMTVWLCILNIGNITIYFIYNQTINSKLNVLYPFA